MMCRFADTDEAVAGRQINQKMEETVGYFKLTKPEFIYREDAAAVVKLKRGPPPQLTTRSWHLR